MRRADRICLSCRYQTVGQSEEAAYEFENAISLMPANPTSYFMAGLHLNAKQQWQAALRVLQRGQQMMVAKDSALGDALAKQVKQAEAGLHEPTH
jgi:lipoprotein NlpI|eukprot:COSAG02_NODE_258_length_26815_cov_12.034998_15_plen_95_part_00